MEEPNGIIALIQQLQALNSASKGLPKDQSQIPKGIVPASEGSSFNKSTLSPILSPTERNRVKQIAEIFKAVILPDPEARAAKVGKSSEPNKEVKSNTESKPAKLHVGVDEKSQGVLGILGSILGVGTSIGSASAIAASALPILAGVIGVAGAIYTAGPAFKMFAEALVILGDVSWDSIKQGAQVVQKLAEVGVYFIGEMMHFGIEAIKSLLSFVGPTLGSIAENSALFNNISWESLGKAAIAISGLFAILAVAGTPELAIFEAIGAAILGLGGLSLQATGIGLTELSKGIDDLFKIFETYKDLPLVTFAKGLTEIMAVLAVVGAAGAASPIIALGALVSQLAGMGLGDLAIGIEAMGKSLPYLSNGISSFGNIDTDHLKNTASGLKDLAAALLGFAGSTFASSVATAFSSIFSSDGFANFLSLADKADKLSSATKSVIGLKDAFKEFATLPTNDLAYNLKEIVNAVDSLNIDKLKKIYQTPGGVMSETMAFEMKTIREYLLFGSGNSNKYGLIGVQKDLLDVNSDQLKTLKEMRTVLLEIRAKIPTNISGSSAINVSTNTQQSKANNFREAFKDLTIQPNYNR